MTRTSGLSFRPAIAVAIALAAVSLMFLTSQQGTEAGGANSLAISPADKEIGVGATASVALVSMPPVESLATWVIDVVFDPTVVSVDSCTPAASPPGSVFVSACEADDQEGGPDDETVVVLGGILFTDTERGFDGETTLASIVFSAVGAIGECSALTINVVSHLGPDPESPETDPATTNGEICIVEEPGTERLWGDSDCSGAVNPVDSLKTLRSDAGLSVSKTGDCPDIASEVTVNGTARLWNDVDCGGAVNPVDSLKTLRHDAGLSVSQAAGCPGMGTTVSVSD
ncbi:MAG: hypothetical protein IIA90_05905 [Chloroflexi bacterium]|nr:hypothetical protein [Chloroflexota bacterium]